MEERFSIEEEFSPGRSRGVSARDDVHTYNNNSRSNSSSSSSISHSSGLLASTKTRFILTGPGWLCAVKDQRLPGGGDVDAHLLQRRIPTPHCGVLRHEQIPGVNLLTR
ncbi:hypothetical protein Trydic_g15206 [Trypoxylus dichotomus]